MKQFVIALLFTFNFLFAQCDKLDNSRFLIVKDKVFDKKTNLTWFRCSIGTTWEKNIACIGTPKIMTFYEVEAMKKNLNNGWRIPTIEELNTIFTAGCKKTAINSVLFPDIKLLSKYAPYWSNTPVKDMPSLIYYIDFIDRKLDAHSKGFSMFLRLVNSNNLINND